MAAHGFGTTRRWVNNDRYFTSKLMLFWVLWSFYRTSPEGSHVESGCHLFLTEKVTICCLKSLKCTCVCEGLSGNSSVILPHSLPNAHDELVGGKSGISECCGKQRTLERNAYDLIHIKSSRVSRLPMIYTIKGIICLIPEPFTFWKMMIKKF